MNEQIKKIADEAKKFHYRSLAPATHSLPVSKVKELANQANAAGIEIISDKFCERFAELIVKGCVEVIDAQTTVWRNTGIPAEVALDMAKENVKAYFGVE